MAFLNSKTAKQCLIGLMAVIILLVVFLGFKYHAWEWISRQLNENTHPVLILGLFAVLPVLGFPISIFLVLLGLRFGPWYGMLFMMAGMPLHLLATFGLSHSFLRPWMERFAQKKAFTIPRVPAHRQVEFSFIFMAVPGLPYTVKNYMLALSGVPFHIFFLMGWGVNALLGALFVILGGAATQWGIILPVILVIIAAVIYTIEQWANKKIKTMASEKQWTMDEKKGGN
ncbi:MAG: VTT domain-containing protein [Thermodesulfobacteriota bacterium]|nr:VTT domain-containing protein [Thermodesulfobacteriota bacterium]